MFLALGRRQFSIFYEISQNETKNRPKLLDHHNEIGRQTLHLTEANRGAALVLVLFLVMLNTKTSRVRLSRASVILVDVVRRVTWARIIHVSTVHYPFLFRYPSHDSMHSICRRFGTARD